LQLATIGTLARPSSQAAFRRGPSRYNDDVDDRRRAGQMLYGREHVKKYRETGGEEGHEWLPGVYTLLLTTTGHKSGNPYTTPLIYGEDGSDYIIVASKGGDDEHPDWYRNIESDPEVEIQVGSEVMTATARTASSDQRPRLWEKMAKIWPDYNEYTKKTDREIPVVVLTPHS
jgi:deazaflavin-dependent oxidoreductase (nitroreductase family)